MKRITGLVIAVAFLIFGMSEGARAQMCEVGCYESAEISCAADIGCGGGYDTCDYGTVSCYGDDGCYDACNIGCCGGGCCLGGLASLVSGVVSIAMTPIHWVACLFSCGTFADCGCAPPYQECYSNPCDMCGNYAGECGGCGNPYYGYQGYYAAQGASAYPTSEYAAPAATPQQSKQTARRPNPSLNSSAGTNREYSDYVDFDKVETIGQRKIRRQMEEARLQSGQAGSNAEGTEYLYNEQVYNDAAIPTQIPSRAAAVKQPVNRNPNGKLIRTARTMPKRVNINRY